MVDFWESNQMSHIFSLLITSPFMSLLKLSHMEYELHTFNKGHARYLQIGLLQTHSSSVWLLVQGMLAQLLSGEGGFNFNFLCQGFFNKDEGMRGDFDVSTQVSYTIYVLGSSTIFSPCYALVVSILCVCPHMPSEVSDMCWSYVCRCFIGYRFVGIASRNFLLDILSNISL